MVDLVESPEPPLDAAAATLRTRLDDYIDAVNAGLPAADVLEKVPADAVYVGGFKSIVYPMIEVSIPDFDVTQLAIGNSGGDMTPVLVVRALSRDVTPERVYRRALRYGRAMLSCLKFEPDAFGPSVSIHPSRGIRGHYAFNPETATLEEATGTSLLLIFLDAAP